MLRFAAPWRDAGAGGGTLSRLNPRSCVSGDLGAQVMRESTKTVGRLFEQLVQGRNDALCPFQSFDHFR
jgi:hypothetical protein